ncbi:MAG: hypothetical protein ACJ71Z_12120 [Aeromicrobium sp.]
MKGAAATPRRMRALAAFLFGWVAIFGVVACGSEPQPRPVVPDGFDVPKGVQITDGGAKRHIGKPSTVVYQIEQRAASAVTVTVTQVEQGDLARDFQFFNLPEEVKSSTPLYVHLQVRNDGPSGLGGVALPIFLRTTSGRVYPPNDLVGEFRPCPNPALPASFLAGSKAELCLVFLLPKGQQAKSVDIQTGEPLDAIHYVVAQT